VTPEVAAHPQIPCSRCGVFIASPAELTLLDGKTYCGTCAARPDVNYLETFRLKYWGKRDLWAWLVALSVVTDVFFIGQDVIARDFSGVASNLFGAIVSVCFFLGMSWARYGLIATVLPSLARTLFMEPRELVVPIAASHVIPLFITAAIFFDTRNQLFFKLEIPRAKLQKAWDLYMNNTAARAGFLFALVGLFVPPFAVLGLGASIIGLRNVNPNSTPPIGRKGQAIAGTVISAISLMVWIFMMLWYVLATAAW
jgi:hypothetical protein